MKVYKDIEQHDMEGNANPEWLSLRAGKFTGSDFSVYMGMLKTGKLSETAKKELSKKILENFGYRFDTFQTPAMARGIELEPTAREAYSFIYGRDIQEVGFVDLEKYHAGCSPDGVIYDEDGNIKEIIEIKCLPDDAQILTNKGFINIKELSAEHIVAQYTKDGKIEFVKPLGVLHEHYNGDLYNFYRYNKLTMSCTSTHRVIYRNRKTGEIKECLAKDYPKKSNRQILVGGYVAGNTSITDETRFLIACNADGHIVSNKSIVFDFSKKRKIDRLLKLLNSIGVAYEIKPERVFNNERWHNSKRIIVKVDNAKRFKQGLSSIGDLRKISTKQANEIIEEIALWDGTVGKSNTIAYTSMNKEDVDFVSALCVIANKKSNVCVGSNESFMITISGYGTQSKNNLPCMCFSENNSGQKIKTTQYDGMVHCVKVPSGMFVARMPNSCAFITGNCPLIETFVSYLDPDFMNPDYATQCQFNMFITGADVCHFVVYHPDFNLIVRDIPKDEEMQNKIQTALEKLQGMYDEMYERISKQKLETVGE